MSTQRLVTLFVGAALLGTAALPAHAALITFSDRGLFNVAAPGLTVETFETGLVNAAGITACNGPLSSNATSACFASGTLAPGITYTASPGSSIVLLGAGFPSAGNTSRVLGPNAFADSLNLTFTSANAAGLDVFAGPLAGNVLLSVFNPANVLLGSFTILAPLGGTFFGVLSDAGPLGRLNISSQTPQPGELVDNVAFGTASSNVPEPASIVLLSIGLSAGLAVRRGRR